MKAVILAAGRGTRLGPKYAGQPKILLQFGGRSLLDWHAQRLSEAGITRAVLVTGYQREAISGVLNGVRKQYDLDIKEMVNPDFAEGSMLSLRAALPELENADEPVLLMDADVLYPAAMLQRLMQSQHPTALLIDRAYSKADHDAILVPIHAGRPVDLGMNCTGEADVVGESIGFFKLDREDLPLLVGQTAQRSSGPHEAALRALVLAGRFGYEDVTGMPWIEIDFPRDVERATQEILPAIGIDGPQSGADVSLTMADHESTHTQIQPLDRHGWRKYADAIMAVEAAAFPPSIRHTREYLAAILQNEKSASVIALVGHGVAGFCFGGPLEAFPQKKGTRTDPNWNRHNTLYAADLAVAPDCRWQGLGFQLKEAQIRLAKEIGYEFIAGRNRVAVADAVWRINRALGAYQVQYLVDDYDEDGLGPRDCIYYHIGLRQSSG
jgi:choline kinase/GNAT superfamily N-acetyltransferase